MKILVLNCGSSSVKYQVIEMEDEVLLCKGKVEKIGEETSFITHTKGEKKWKFEKKMENHEEAISEVLKILKSPEYGVIKDFNEIYGVGHRVVHGGEFFKDSVLVDEDVKDAIRKCIELAPLHNPHNLRGIEVMENLIPGVKQVAVFDTSFHQTLPPRAYLYAIPYEYYLKYRIRRYGFHGTSHRYVYNRFMELTGMDREKAKVITCHLGNGCSVTAIKGGKSIDTSMGFTPVEGLVMGTRSGDIDPALLLYLMENENLSTLEANNLINKKSGVLGLSGISNDMRIIEEGYFDNREEAVRAFEVYIYRIVKYIGAYAAVLNGVNGIVFTGGVGENSSILRRRVCENLEYLGVKIDLKKNESLRGEGEISSKDSEVKVFSISTNEELLIARDTYKIIKEEK